mgnify:CR=1 FL=1
MASDKTGDSGRVSLSAIDFLGLTKQRKVARIDLAEAGYEGVIYVRDLTAAEQSKVTSISGKGGKLRLYQDKSREIDLAALTAEAGPPPPLAAGGPRTAGRAGAGGGSSPSAAGAGATNPAPDSGAGLCRGRAGRGVHHHAGYGAGADERDVDSGSG